MKESRSSSEIYARKMHVSHYKHIHCNIERKPVFTYFHFTLVNRLSIFFTFYKNVLNKWIEKLYRNPLTIHFKQSIQPICDDA